MPALPALFTGVSFFTADKIRPRFRGNVILSTCPVTEENGAIVCK
jgi:hypothetical protein